MFDSQGRFFFNEEIDLPVDVEQYKGRPEFINPEQLPYLCFAIENSQGKHVGIANLFNVNERHGTFGPIGIVINPQDPGQWLWDRGLSHAGPVLVPGAENAQVEQWLY